MPGGRRSGDYGRGECPACGGVFTKGRSTQVYCDSDCRLAGHWMRPMIASMQSTVRNVKAERIARRSSQNNDG